MAGPFVGPIGQVADRIANILNPPLFSPFIEQLCELFERRTAGGLSHPAGEYGSSAEADQDRHHDEDASTPVSHPANIARFSDHPAQKHPGGEKHEEDCEKVHHGVKLTRNAGLHC